MHTALAPTVSKWQPPHVGVRVPALIVANNASHFSLAVHLLPVEPTNDETGAMLVVDFPTGFALRALESLQASERRRALVLTAGETAAYEDALGSLLISGITSLAETQPTQRFKLEHAAVGRRTFTPFYNLTFSELRILRMLLTGWTTKPIAEDLRLTEKTINSHISSLLRKLGCADRTALVAQTLTANRG